MPATRRTNNLRIFKRELQRALVANGFSNTSYGDITPTAWRDMLNSVGYTMKISDNVVFYNNTGDGHRVPVTDEAARLAKLTRFLKRTVESEIPHIKVAVKEQSGLPWFSVYEDSGMGNGESEQDGDGEGRETEQNQGQNGNGDNEQDGQSDQSGNSELDQNGEGDEPTEEQIAAMSSAERIAYETDKFEPQSDNQTEDEFAKWWRILAKLRDYCRDSAAQGLPIDDFESYRPGIMGAAMIREGITADACADAATAHWSEDAREDCEIKAVNVADIIPAPEGTHPATGYVAKLMRARIPVMLHGGAGVGKTTLARDAAELFNLDFGMLSMTAGLSTTALTGSVNLQGFVSRPCVDTFSDGGVFLFDEMDAADPNLLLICNTMLANGEFHSPITGERLTRHTHWFPFAAVNTLNGASTAYTGRTRLDHATMDRWRMGRVRMSFNTDMALDFALTELRG